MCVCYIIVRLYNYLYKINVICLKWMCLYICSMFSLKINYRKILQHTTWGRCDVRARAEREQRNALCSSQHHRGWRWTTKMAGGNSNYWEGEVAKRYKFRSTKCLIALCDSSRQFLVLNSLWRRFHENAVRLPR